MLKNPIKTDMVIVGAGLIGASMALSMQNQSCTMAILETHLPELFTKANADSRPISLSYGSVCLLKSWGVWGALEKEACPILSVHVSEKGKLGAIHFSAQELRVPALGFVVLFEKLLSALFSKINTQQNIQFFPIQSIQNIICDQKGVAVHANTRDFQASLLIAADGTHSTCRDLLSIETIEKNDRDQAMIYQLILSESHECVAYERFTQYGVLAVLPLLDKKSARLVWTISPRQFERVKSWREKDILCFLQTVFEGRLSIVAVTKTTCFPLKTVLAKTQIKPSAVLLGNAAHTIYPVAAQGFNLGLRDVATLCDILIEALDEKKKLNDFFILKIFEAQVRDYQKVILNITNQLAPFFDIHLPGLGVLRGLGLLSMDMILPLKNNMARHLMGKPSSQPSPALREKE